MSFARIAHHAGQSLHKPQLLHSNLCTMNTELHYSNLASYRDPHRQVWPHRAATSLRRGDWFEYFGRVYRVVDARLDREGHAILRVTRPDNGCEWGLGFGPRVGVPVQP